MMPRLFILIFSLGFFLAGCLGPAVNSCLVDLNRLDTAVNALTFPVSKDQVLKLVHQTPTVYCVPPNAKDVSKDFLIPLKTGDHYYTSEDWGILMHWIVDHSK